MKIETILIQLLNISIHFEEIELPKILRLKIRKKLNTN